MRPLFFAALFLALSIGSAQAAKFFNTVYDSDIYYLSPGQTEYGSPDTSKSQYFEFYTGFNTTGVTIREIQGAHKGDVEAMCGLYVRLTDGREWQIGSLTASGCTSTGLVQFDVGEYITEMRERSDDKRTCDLAFRTSRQSGDKDYGIRLGCKSCANGKDWTKDVGSGIIAGFFGYASSERIYQLGVLYIYRINSGEVVYSDIDTKGQTPKYQMIDSKPYDNRNSPVDYITETFTTSNSIGYSYKYDTTTSTTNYFGISLGGSYKYTSTTPKSKSQAEINLDTEYQYTVTNTEQKSSSYDSESTNTTTWPAQCCPAYTKCTWSWYQAFGELKIDDGAIGKSNTTLKLASGKSITYPNTESSYTGSSSYGSAAMVANMEPLSDTKVTNCGTVPGRKLAGMAKISGDPKIKKVTLKSSYVLPKSFRKGQLLRRLVNAGLSKEDILKRNPSLTGLKDTDTIKAGQRIKFLLDREMVMYNTKIK